MFSNLHLDGGTEHFSAEAMLLRLSPFFIAGGHIPELRTPIGIHTNFLAQSNSVILAK
jgi:hypothetical protein